MDINITFDVAEKLFPNILTVIVQLCSTGVIFFVAYKFLWNPAREFLAAKAELTQKELNEAKEDLDIINNLPGKKIFIKGNHDFWWSTATKINTFF